MSTVNDYYSVPKQTLISDKATSRVFSDVYNSGREYDPEQPVTGKIEVGLLDPREGRVNLQPNLETIESGAEVSALEEIVLGWNGTGEFLFQDENPTVSELQNGTTAGRVRDYQPDTPIVGDLATGSTTKLIQLAEGEAAAFAGQEGRVILVPTADDDAPPMRTHIRRVDTANDTITPFEPLSDVPAESGEVAVLAGFKQYWGGSVGQQREMIFTQEFGKQGRHVTVIPRCQGTSGKDVSLANGVQKRRVNMKIQAHSEEVDGYTQQVPLITYGIYGRAAV